MNRVKRFLHERFYPVYVRIWAERFFKIGEGQIVIDAGAYLGEFTFYAAKKVGEHGQVVAFEPEPVNFAILKENLEKSGLENIILINKALGDELKEVEIESLGPFSSVEIRKFKNRTHKTQQTTLDNEINRLGIGKIDMVKMNIEGSEIKAIEGATQTLKRTANIAISCHVVDGKYTNSAIEPILKNLGFEIKTVRGKRILGDIEHIDIYGISAN